VVTHVAISLFESYVLLSAPPGWAMSYGLIIVTSLIFFVVYFGIKFLKAKRAQKKHRSTENDDYLHSGLQEYLRREAQENAKARQPSPAK
jgi:hypothetical protein